LTGEIKISIKLKNNNPISKHFNDITHTYNNLTIIPTEIKIDHEKRIYKEKSWIRELVTYYPYGINYYPIS